MTDKQDLLVIKFKAIDKYATAVAIPPSPASEFIPKWWRDMEVSTSEHVLSRPGEDASTKTYVHTTGKRCFPMLDALTAGYILPLWADVEVTLEPDGSPTMKWLVDRPVFGFWYQEFTNGMDIPEDSHPVAFKYCNQYIIETPPGWSCLFMPPAGYPNLPFHTITGVVDTDVLKTDINQPIWLKKGFTGIIKKGTPIAQIVPFQRQDWTNVVIDELEHEEHYHNQQKYIRTEAGGAYGYNQRVKKNFK